MPIAIRKSFLSVLSVILPTLIFAAAIFPFSCNFSRDAGVYKSGDGGQTWQQKVAIEENKTIGTKEVISMAIDETNPDIIYLGTSGGGLWKSLDAAESWQQAADQAGVLKNNDDILDIKIDKKNSDVIFVAVNQDKTGRVLKTEDAGARWKEIFTVSKSGLSVQRIFIDGSGNSAIYIGTSAGELLRSVDSGVSWSKIGGFAGGVIDINVDPRANNVIYIVVAGRGLYKSTDSGQNWIFLDDKMADFSDSKSAAGILIDPRDPNILYLRLKNNLLTSSDSGETWRAVTILAPAKAVAISAFVQDQARPENFYYAAGPVFYKTLNSGQTWTTIRLPGSRQVSVIRISPSSSNIIYVGRHQ